MIDQKEIRALISLLDDEDDHVFSHVTEKLASFGQAIIPFLQKELNNTENKLVKQRLSLLLQDLNYDNILSKLKTWSESEDQDLLKALWIIASYQYPGLAFETIYKELEQIYYEAWLDFRYEMHPFDQVKVLNSIIFRKLNFKANTGDFYAPSNSMINDVLNNKTGNPISLCIVYMLVANKLKLPVFGVNLPKMFILTYKDERFQFYINAFNKGLIFSKADIDNYLGQLKLEKKETYYEPCSNVVIVKRILYNLIDAYQKQGDIEKTDELQNILAVLEK
ncbi:MAG: hypothetical protein F6K11_34090 [Leptolyngbya sp. SIO3F4]|nr:hypothetical protein [Leptolyngbya sp. SIO3F4]